MSGPTFTLQFVVAFLTFAQAVVPPADPPPPPPPPAAHSEPPDRWSHKLLLMMFDGMRWDSVNDNLPGMREMKENGVHARHLVPCYPTSSLPNHLCILTGLYAESHGLIENEMYDESLDESLTMRNMTQPSYQDSPWWHRVEPIWSAAAKQERRVKVYHWFEAPIEMNGFKLTPAQMEKPDVENVHDVQHLEETVHEALVKLARDQLDLAVVYFGNPDHVQHYHGFGSPTALKMIRDLDDVVLQLQMNSSVLTMPDGKTRLRDKLDVMLVSDHGHMNYSHHGAVNVTGVLARYNIKHVQTSGPQLAIWPNGNGDEIVRELQQVPNMKVYHREEIPARWHYRNSPYTPPILAVVEPGCYFITPDRPSLQYSDEDKSYVLSGHGYDNNVTEMQAIFLARGPHFKTGMTVEPVENVHLYQMMCAILGIKPAPNDGSVSAVRPFVVDLFNPERISHVNISIDSVLLTVIIALSGLLVLTCIFCGLSRIKRRKKTEQYKTLLSADDLDSGNEDAEI